MADFPEMDKISMAYSKARSSIFQNSNKRVPYRY